MNSKLLQIMAIGLTTLFLSAQAFAWAGAGKDKDVGSKTDQDTCMYDRDDSATDRDIGNMDQGGADSSKSQDMDRSQTDQFDINPPLTY
jgi:hypothetical protein